MLRLWRQRPSTLHQPKVATSGVSKIGLSQKRRCAYLVGVYAAPQVLKGAVLTISSGREVDVTVPRRAAGCRVLFVHLWLTGAALPDAAPTSNSAQLPGFRVGFRRCAPLSRHCALVYHCQTDLMLRLVLGKRDIAV